MKTIQSFKQNLGKVFSFWEKNEFANALELVEKMKGDWPGNAQLHLLWAGLVQLQDETEHSLAEAKTAIEQAIALEKDSPAGHIELGHFLSAVEDDPKAAVKAFSEAVHLARRLLIDGLLGQAKALLELEKREPAIQCLKEALYLHGLDPTRKQADDGLDVFVGDVAGRFMFFQAKEGVPHQMRDLLEELVSRNPD